MIHISLTPFHTPLLLFAERLITFAKRERKVFNNFNLATMDNKEFLETNELYIAEIDFAVGKNFTELKKSINEKK